MKFLLAVTLLVSSLVFGQNQPQTYNHTTGLFTWQVSQDTTQAMYGCSTNNYNAEGQCTGSYQWYYHTAQVYLTVHNRRTGVTQSSGNTVYAGVATGTISMAVLPGDVLDVTETSRVWCPVANVWYGFANSNLILVIAYTQAIYIGPTTDCHSGASGTTWCEFRVGNFCTAATTPPDMSLDFQNINDMLPAAGAPNGWDVYGVCIGIPGTSPKACSYGVALSKRGSLSPVSCTRT